MSHPIESDETILYQTPTERLIPLRQLASEVARLTREVGRLAHRYEADRRRIKAYRSLVASIWDDCFANHGSEIVDIREQIRREIHDDNMFEDCDVCGGSGEVADERDCWSERAGHYTRPVADECGSCIDGRVPR